MEKERKTPPFRSLFGVVLSYAMPFLMVVTSFLFIKKTDVKLHFGAYLVKEQIEMPEYNATGTLYVHKRLGYELLHVSSADRVNFFASTLRTAAKKRSGLARALQKFVDCGSDKYPFAKVFEKLKKKSAAIDIGSEVGAEISKYSFSTTNKADFFSILPIFMDSVFHCRLNDTIFNQKVHRLVSEYNDSESYVLRRKGEAFEEAVLQVFNPETFTRRRVMEGLLENVQTFADQFGEPEVVAGLSLADVRKYYTEHYHPSNALFFHYGDIPAKEVLENISAFFSSYTWRAPQPLKPHDDRWNYPHRRNVTGPFPELMPSKKRATISWLMNDISNISDIVDMEILAHILTDGPNPLLMSQVIDSGHATRMCETGFFTDVGTPYFTICFDGVPKEINFTNYVYQILDSFSTNGFDDVLVKKIHQQYEINKTEVSNSLGQELYNKIALPWAHGNSPSDFLSLSWEIERVKRLLAVQPKYFEVVLKQKLVNNFHRLDMDFSYDDNYEKDFMTEQEEKLTQISKKMTKDDYITSTNLSTEILSNDPSTIPHVNLSELQIPVEEIDYNANSSYYTFEKQTNGLFYISVKSQVPLYTECIENVPVFLELYGKLGAGDLNTAEFQSATHLSTGGISIRAEVYSSQTDSNSINLAIVVEGHALARNANSLFELMKSLLLRPHFNSTTLISDILKSKVTSFYQELQDNCSKFASMFASAGLTKAAALREMLFGISANNVIQKYVSDGNCKVISSLCQTIYESLFLMGNFSSSVHGSKELCERYENRIISLIKKLNAHQTPEKGIDTINLFMAEMQSWSKAIVKIDKKEGCSAISIRGFPFLNKYSTSLDFVSKIILNYELSLNMERIGSQVNIGSHDPHLGVLEYSSSGDSNISRSVEILEKTIYESRRDIYTDDMITTTILELYKEWTYPSTPGNYGDDYFIYGITPQMKHNRFVSTLNITQSDLANILSQIRKEKKQIAVVGSTSGLIDLDDYQIFEPTFIY